MLTNYETQIAVLEKQLEHDVVSQSARSVRPQSPPSAQVLLAPRACNKFIPLKPIIIPLAGDH
jgi:hypothetical protein